MCAGLSFSIDNINSKELDRYVTPKEFLDKRKNDLFQIFYWDRMPFLPVLEEDIHLYEWGNRNQTLKLPKTGWAKIESVRDGCWDWLSPKMVTIPSLMGYEKRRWFKTPRGIKGIKVRYHNVVRVYLLTQKSDAVFRKYTGHDRMPVGKIVPLTTIL
jgi:hypothetical protein